MLLKWCMCVLISPALRVLSGMMVLPSVTAKHKTMCRARGYGCYTEARNVVVAAMVVVTGYEDSLCGILDAI